MIKRCFFWLLVFSSIVSTVRCGKWPQKPADIRNAMKVLAIGNSWTHDAFAYVPAVMSSLGVQDSFAIAMVTASGTHLQHHVEQFNDKSYEYCLCRFPDGPWQEEYDVSPSEALSRYDWDIVVLQQQSVAAGEWATYQPWLDRLVDSLHRYAPQCEIVWLMTPSRADQLESSDVLWSRICNNADLVMENTCISHVIPEGTAIQNARHSVLCDVADGNELFSGDNLHLQDGIPRLTAAFSVAQSLLHWHGIQYSILDCPLNPDEDFCYEWKIPHTHGETVLASQNYLRLARQCAAEAFDNPRELWTGERAGDFEKK